MKTITAVTLLMSALALVPATRPSRAQAQERTRVWDPTRPTHVEIRKEFLATKFVYESGEVSAYGKEAQAWLASLEDTHLDHEYGLARNRHKWSNIIGGVAGFFIAWQGVQGMFGDDPNWWIMGTGVALVVPSWFLDRSAHQHLTTSASLYNTLMASGGR